MPVTRPLPNTTGISNDEETVDWFVQSIVEVEKPKRLDWGIFDLSMAEYATQVFTIE